MGPPWKGGIPHQHSPTFPVYSPWGYRAIPQQQGEGKGLPKILPPAHTFLFLFGFIEKKE